MWTALLDDRVRLARGFLAPERAAELFAALQRETPWLAVRYENHDAPVELPRLTRRCRWGRRGASRCGRGAAERRA